MAKNINQYYDSYLKFHFRHHNSRQHKVLVIGEDKNNYNYMLTSTNPKRDKNHLNYEFIYHPFKKIKQSKLKKGEEKSYLEKKIKSDSKFLMPKRSNTWHLHHDDYKEIKKIIHSKKK